MPAPAIVFGVEFPWHSGGSVSTFVTVFNSAGNWQLRTEQEGTDRVVFTFVRNNGQEVTRSVRPDPGSEILITEAQSAALPGNLDDFTWVRQHVTVSFTPSRQPQARLAARLSR